MDYHIVAVTPARSFDIHLRERYRSQVEGFAGEFIVGFMYDTRFVDMRISHFIFFCRQVDGGPAIVPIHVQTQERQAGLGGYGDFYFFIEYGFAHRDKTLFRKKDCGKESQTFHVRFRHAAEDAMFGNAPFPQITPDGTVCGDFFPFRVAIALQKCHGLHDTPAFVRPKAEIF